MSLFPCSACHERKPGKYANVTIAWWTAANVRIAYRQRLCIACYSEHILPIDASEDAESLVCPMCHSVSADDLDPVYITAFIPQVGRQQMELATDAPCAARFRIWAQDNGARLEDASGGQGPGPQTSEPDLSAWAKIMEASHG